MPPNLLWKYNLGKGEGQQRTCSYPYPKKVCPRDVPLSPHTHTHMMKTISWPPPMKMFIQREYWWTNVAGWIVSCWKHLKAWVRAKRISRICYVNCWSRKDQWENLIIESKVNPMEEMPRQLAVEDMVPVEVNDQDRKMRIRVILTAEQNVSMTGLLKEFRGHFLGNPVKYHVSAHTSSPTR